ncbi:DUF6744 family protein [Nocardia sp. NPDC047038]|uniref:DUF6744 family protein n=1 Tax=Nocardia sp. NPDC047038 TaxID=3154338 RepID=UPI0034086538
MTTTTASPTPLPPDNASARERLSTYSQQADQAPSLGFVVLYSVFGGEVTPETAAAWFRELRLDQSFLPGKLRADNAFERVTGSDGVHDTYDLADVEEPSPTVAGAPAAQSSARTGVRSANLMIRHVRRSQSRIMRHIVREVRDETASELAYDTHLGEVEFRRAAGHDGSGTLSVTLDYTAVGSLPAAEQARVHALASKIDERYLWQCTYLGSDRVRTILLKYMRALEAVALRPTGGVYFVTAEHADTLAALREFTDRVGDGSLLARIPLADQAEMRQLVIHSFVTSARDELQKLSLEIAAASRGVVSSNKLTALHDRYRAVKAQTEKYSQRLATSLGETEFSLQLVQQQLAALFKVAD